MDTLQDWYLTYRKRIGKPISQKAKAHLVDSPMEDIPSVLTSTEAGITFGIKKPGVSP